MFRIFCKIYVEHVLKMTDIKLEQPIIFKIQIEYFRFFNASI